MTDSSRWSDPGSLGHWRRRAELAAAWIPPWSSVVDLGCGDQCLKEYLRESFYLPVDLHPHHTYCYVADLEKDALPPVQATHVVALGLLEYIRNKEHLVNQITSTGARLIISYHFGCTSDDWVDMINEQEFWTLFRGYERIEWIELDSCEMLFYLRRNDA